LAALLTASLIGVVSSSASAEWGYGCNRPNNLHCYAYSDWAMSEAKGEQVLGLVSWITTERMNVSDWFRINNVSNEQWAAETSHGS
jgi:hypothetical protein